MVPTAMLAVNVDAITWRGVHTHRVSASLIYEPSYTITENVPATQTRTIYAGLCGK